MSPTVAGRCLVEGVNDLFWAPGPENGTPRFAWTDLAAFDATPGEQNGRYLSTADLTAILAADGIPTTAP